MRRFKLIRVEDETGISGEGVVAEGVEFTSGICVLSWLTEIRSIAAIYDSIDVIDHIHGHNGKTLIVWDDAFKQTIIGRENAVKHMSSLLQELWLGWIKDILPDGQFNDNGTWTMPTELVGQLQGAEMSYDEFVESQKPKTEKDARLILSMIEIINGSK